MAIEPDQKQFTEIAALAARPAESPVVMLNLNRYRERAAYEAGSPAGADTGLSGREAYERYGEVATRVLERLGGKILWHTRAQRTVIGAESERWDEVIAVWYPSVSAFVALATDPEIVAALEHRRAGLEWATLICCDSGAEPILAGS